MNYDARRERIIRVLNAVSTDGSVVECKRIRDEEWTTKGWYLLEGNEEPSWNFSEFDYRVSIPCFHWDGGPATKYIIVASTDNEKMVDTQPTLSYNK